MRNEWNAELFRNETSVIPFQTISQYHPHVPIVSKRREYLGSSLHRDRNRKIHEMENIERGFTKQPEWLIKAITNDIIRGRDIRWPALKILLSSQAIYMENRILLSGGTDGQGTLIDTFPFQSIALFLSLSLSLSVCSFLFHFIFSFCTRA